MPDLHPRIAGALREPIAPIAPPATLEARVLSAVAGAAMKAAPTRVRRERVPRRRLMLAFGGAAVLLAAFVIAGSVLRGGAPQGTLELSTVLVTETGQAEATVEVRKTGIGRVIELRSDSLPILPKGEYYELWFVGPGDSLARPNRISAGTFHPDEDGRSQVRFAAAVDPALYPRLVVTAEPGDGDPRPSGNEVLMSESS